MRKDLRNYLLQSLPELDNVYEPGVVTKDSPKPYAIIVETKDINEDKILRFTKNIEIWFYCERTSFTVLDSITQKAINALDKHRINGEESFTCVFDGYVLHDGVDDNFDVIFKGLRFQVINLYEDNNSQYVDPWLTAVSNYINGLFDNSLTIYTNTWKQDFSAPSLLVRVKRSKTENINWRTTRTRKTIVIHCLTDDLSLDADILNTISDNLSYDFKIPLNLAEKKYLTLKTTLDEKIEINYEADPLSRGQMTVTFERLDYHRPKDPGMITDIKSRWNKKGGKDGWL